MIKSLAVLIGLGSLLVAQDTETKVKMKDLPPAVQAAVKEQSKGATVKGLAREVEDGKTKYEAELRVNGKTRDVTFDETGAVVTIEEEVTISAIPAPAREAIQRGLGGNKLLLVETVKEGNATFYEAHYKKSGKEEEIKVDRDGRPVK